MKRLLFGVLPIVAFACSAPDKGARTDPAVAPSGPAFKPVAQVLVDRCGSIDCHGSTYRNMRLWGFGSHRLDPAHQPDAPETTQAEADADYDAVVGLEPEVFREVVAGGGTDTSRLTFMRKARNEERHEGGGRIVPNDAADICIRSWLAKNVDAATCKAAVPRLAAEATPDAGP